MGLAVEMSFVGVDRLCRLCNVGLFHLSSNLWRPGRWAWIFFFMYDAGFCEISGIYVKTIASLVEFKLKCKVDVEWPRVIKRLVISPSFPSIRRVSSSSSQPRAKLSLPLNWGIRMWKTLWFMLANIASIILSCLHILKGPSETRMWRQSTHIVASFLWQNWSWHTLNGDYDQI